MQTKMKSVIKGFTTLVFMGLFLFAVFKIGWLVGRITSQDTAFPSKEPTAQSAAPDIGAHDSDDGQDVNVDDSDDSDDSHTVSANEPDIDKSVTIRESNADHGDTLEEVILGISNEPYEYEAVFYGEHKITEVTDYNEKKVSYTYQWSDALAVDMIAVHNHPIDCAFSCQDLDGLCRRQHVGTSIVVSSETKYTLSAPDGWPSADDLASYFANEYGIDIDFDADTCTVSIHVGDERLERLHRDGYTIRISDSSFGLTGKAISEFADCYGLVYTEEPLSDITSF